jgi:hypothetical protein
MWAAVVEEPGMGPRPRTEGPGRMAYITLCGTTGWPIGHPQPASGWAEAG